MILLIDNYDSFSYNVYQLVGSVNPDIRVIRNDECSVDEIRAMNPSHIILSQMGIANAAVLPLPVGALPTTFFPSSIAGITCCWISVGLS